MVIEKTFQDIKNLQTLIEDYEKKGWSLRIKETNDLLDSLTKKKMSYIETQKIVQKDIDSINEYNANQEVIFFLSDNKFINIYQSIQSNY